MWHFFFVCVAVAFLGSTTQYVDAADERPPKPNIIVFLIDDMGLTDLGCYDSQFFETPHIDRLADSGMRFTAGYSACTVCSPTRAAMLTGKYPARLHITDWIAGHERPKAKLKIPDWTKSLPLEEVTIAEVLKKQGYATAHIGKWHLAEDRWPKAQGFDLNIGGNHRGQPPSYFFPYETKEIKLPGLAEGKPGEYLTDRLTDEALAFVNAHKDKPFFLYFPHYAVHTPLQAKDEVTKKYQDKAKTQPDYPQKNAKYAAMVESVDDSVGRIVERLVELNLRNDTIIVFTSDNGGLLGSTTNLNLRAGKGSAYEGGVRVPWIVSYPARVKPATENATPVITCDLFPTLAALAGVKELPADIDGENLTPLLTGEGTFKPRPLFWHYPHYHPGGATPYGAVREENYRLVEFYETGKLELYDLAADPLEKDDLAAKQPDLTGRLHKLLAEWRTEVGAQMPTPNPTFEP